MDRFVVKNADSQFQWALSWNHRQQTLREEYEDDYRLGATRYYSDDYGADFAYENTADFFKQQNRLSLGIVPTFEPESDSSYADQDGNLGVLLAADRTYYLNLPFYLENEHHFTPAFSLLTGFQAVYVDRIFKDRFRSPTLDDQSHDDHFLAFNPKLGIAYHWNEPSLVYANVSRSFQPPSFDESLGVQEGTDGGEVFHDLHSQHAVTLELGTRGEKGPLQWDVALYRSWVRDELLDQNNAQGEPLGTINAPRTIHQGIESGLETELFHALLIHPVPVLPAKDAKTTATARATDRLILEQTYTLSDFRFDDNPVYGTHRVAGTPVHFYKAELRYEHPSGFYLGTNAEWNVVKYPVDEATRSLPILTLCSVYAWATAPGKASKFPSRPRTSPTKCTRPRLNLSAMLAPAMTPIPSIPATDGLFTAEFRGYGDASCGLAVEILVRVARSGICRCPLQKESTFRRAGFLLLSGVGFHI